MSVVRPETTLSMSANVGCYLASHHSPRQYHGTSSGHFNPRLLNTKNKTIGELVLDHLDYLSSTACQVEPQDQPLNNDRVVNNRAYARPLI